MRLICESCESGYPVTMASCPWCGCSPNLAHESTVVSVLDTECYRDYLLVMFSTGEVFEFFPGHPLDIAGLRRALGLYTIVTFNGRSYDFPIIGLALTGADNDTLKRASDAIICDRAHPWDIPGERLDWVDHIDMIEVAPGQSSLKAYGGKMHAPRLQDLPIDPGSSIDWPQRVQLREYCRNDLDTTRQLYDTFPAQLALRVDMGAEYGLDLRSKSDAQIAEAVMKRLLPFEVQRPYIPAGHKFYYQPPTWMRFATPYMQDVFKRIVESPYYVTETGGISPDYKQRLIDWPDTQLRLGPHGAWVKRPSGWRADLVSIGGTGYAVGTGGLHSTESSIAQRADPWNRLTDHDVASYYPSLMIETGIYPPQIGETFNSIYRGWYDRRIAAKRAGDKKVANSLKTLLNGTFGKLGSKWSIFYHPAGLIQVTVTGQLALLMLAEMLELCGISVVSANTDGIVLRTPVALEWVRDQIIAWWENTTGFETERADYAALYSRDVNNYIAVKLDGTVKLKGAYAPPEPGASGWPNPTGQVCVDAVVAYLTTGTPLAATIRACRDIRSFVYVRAVKGGGSLARDRVLPGKASKKRMVETAGSVEGYEADAARSRNGWEYLGKVVRWYYRTGSVATIRTPTGSLVPRTDGSEPLMQLPDTLPADIDYDWYEREARSILIDIGYGK